VLERGHELALAGALGALDPDQQTSPRALADAVEVASRVRRFAIGRGGEKDPLAERAADVARRGVARLAAYAAIHGSHAEVPIARALPHVPLEEAGTLGKAVECPSEEGSLDARLEVMESEPLPVGGAVRSCWDAFASSLAQTVQAVGSAEEHARLLLAAAERPHRQALAISLADRLRERVDLKPSGAIRLADGLGAQRATRAIVFAALLRAVHIGRPSAADAPRLAAWIGVQRDADGGYGSALATRSAVRALLAEGAVSGAPSKVVVEASGERREVEVAASAQVIVPLPDTATKASVRVRGAGVVARFERPVLRLWAHPPSAAAGPLQIEAEWPDDAKAGKSGKLVVRLRHGLGRQVTADATIPLPPGAALAAPVEGIRQLQGVLGVRRELDGSELPTVVEIPLRFALPGRFTAPEARARVAFEELGRGIAPARPFKVE
jgi:hypothetical protein